MKTRASRHPPKSTARNGIVQHQDPPPKRPAHRPKYEPTEKDRLTVQVMVAGGIEQALIAAVISISPPTLRKHFRREIDTGSAAINAIVVAEHLKRIKAGDFNAIKWWEQSRMGWSEHIVVEPGDKPMRVIIEMVGDPAPPRAEQAAPQTGSRLSDAARGGIELVG